MCGIVGVINKYTNGFTDIQLKAFESLLYIDGLRGLDSTGIFGVDNSGDLVVAKSASNPCVFLEDKAWSTVRQEMFQRGSALIGHNRKATRGDIIDENAHPFLIKDEFCLVHNGTMFGDHKKYADVAVDSHAIAVMMHEKGIKPTVDEINAAYCFFWYDFRTKTIGLVRNKERPMHWFETSDAWYYASEMAFLEFIISRHGLKPLGNIKIQPEHWITEFTLNKNRSWDVDGEEHIPAPKAVSQPSWGNRHWAFGNDSYKNYMDWDNDLDNIAVSEPDLPDPVGEPVNYTDPEAFEKSIAREHKFIIPHSQYLKLIDENHKLDKVYAMLIEARQAPSGNWQLYLDAVDGTFPIIYTFLVEEGMFTKESIAKAVADNVIYDLKLSSVRTWKGVSDKEGYAVCRAVSGTELPNQVAQLH